MRICSISISPDSPKIAVSEQNGGETLTIIKNAYAGAAGWTQHMVQQEAMFGTVVGVF
jgi:hypothetical protein